MPHDKNGKLIEIGDEVILRGKVTSVQASPDYCNCTVQSPYQPPAQMGFTVTGCTQEMEKSDGPAPLTIAQVAEAARKRLPDFKTKDGSASYHTTDGADWSALEWAGAMAGEAGEAANLAKKLRRGDFTLDDQITVKGETKTAREFLGDEIADVMLYAHALARRCGIDVAEAIKSKFNATSDAIGSKVKL